MCTKLRDKWSGARTRESDAPLCHLKADPCQLETDPERTREEPRRCPNITGSGVHGKGLVPNARFSNNMCAVSKQAGKYQRNERASRLLEFLLAAQGKALFEDLNPCRRMPRDTTCP